MNRRAQLSGLVLAAAASAVAAVLPASAPAAEASSAAVSLNKVLFGVSTTSARSAWAVGYRYNGKANQTLIERWNGKAWKQVPSPDPGGRAHANTLFGVAAISGKSAWAVGSYVKGTAGHMLIAHWNGRSWEKVPVPGPACLGPDDGLFGVTAVSTRNAWAVGTATSCVFGDKVTVILHWNGRSWKRMTSPDPGLFNGSSLSGVAAASARSAWAVGFYSTNGVTDQTLIEHWNGKVWSQLPSPGLSRHTLQNFLSGVTAVSAGNAWAVGSSNVTFPHRDVIMILHWNGKSWQRVRRPNPAGEGGDSELLGVTAVTARSAWAVGDYTDPRTRHDRTLIERWNGRSWKKAPSPTPASGHDLGLIGVAASSAKNAWAVGSYASGPAQHPLFEHWNGKSWKSPR